jgi:hypothetical protein
MRTPRAAIPVVQILPALLLLPGLLACSHVRGSGKPLEDRQGKVISAAEIEKSGARNAWDALRRAGTHLRLTEGARGEPGTVRKRGAGSMVLSNAPTVVLDGVLLVDFRTLIEVPAVIIEEIRILNGVDGTARYGTGSGNGVIVVTTRSSLPD